MRRATRPAGLSEAVAGGRYTARWHRVRTWATRVLPGDLSEVPSRFPRVAIVRGQWVADLNDDEEAEHHSTNLGALQLPLGPRGRGRQGGGRRRVVVRTFTWVVDLAAGGVHHDGHFITTGEGMTARAAAAAHNRYVRAYAESVSQGIESRLLRATALEVVFWTARQTVRFV